MIQLNQLKFTFDDSVKPVTMNFDLSVNKGEKLAIVGASGNGKTTLLNLIAGFLFADSGQIILADDDHSRSKPHKRPVSILFQDHNLFNHLSVFDNIAIGIKPNLKLSNEDKTRIADTAKQVGLADMLDKLPNQLSGGQQQRVALARCYLRDTPILLLDEPFSALDKPLRQEMLALLTKLCEDRQLTLLIVTHQLEEISDFVDRVIEVKNGTIFP